MKLGRGGPARGEADVASCRKWVRLPGPVQSPSRGTPRGALFNVDGGKEEIDFRISASAGVARMIKAAHTPPPSWAVWLSRDPSGFTAGLQLGHFHQL